MSASSVRRSCVQRRRRSESVITAYTVGQSSGPEAPGLHRVHDSPGRNGHFGSGRTPYLLVTHARSSSQHPPRVFGHQPGPSAGKLGVDRIDLLILHQALPSAFDRTLAAYRALETLLADGRVRAIGVSNVMVDHLTELMDKSAVVPAVNQIEVHPYFQQREVQAYDAAHGMLTQAWSP